MKREDLTKYHQMSLADLQKEKIRLERHIADIQLKLSLGQQKNLRLKSHLRHDLARINTIMTAKSLAETAKPAVTASKSVKLKTPISITKTDKSL